MEEQLSLLEPNNSTSSTYVEECNYSFDGSAIRVVDSSKDGILFVGRDVCVALGYKNPSAAISAHCKGIAIRYTLSTPGGPQSYVMLKEPDVCRLICRSALPSAARFESWVFDEVLPSIRKTGAYITPKLRDEIINDPDTLIRLCEELKAERKANKELEDRLQHSVTQIGILEPKATLADAFLSSHGNILVRNFAKSVKDALKLEKFGEKDMFKFLRDHNYINADRWPSKKSSDAGWLAVQQGSHWNPVIGVEEAHHTTKITPKGQEYFYRKIKEIYRNS